PHQALFLAARTVHAAGVVPPAGRVPALFPSILSPPSPSPSRGWGRATAGKECSPPSSARDAQGRGLWGGRAVGRRRASRSGRQARTTVYPWGTRCGPRHLVPYTPRASGTPAVKSAPIERTVPVQVHPAAERWPSPTALTSPHRQRARRLSPPL